MDYHVGKRIVSFIFVHSLGFSCLGLILLWILIFLQFLTFRYFEIKFLFSKKATKSDEISTIDLAFTTKRQIFVALLENMNFNSKPKMNCDNNLS